MNRRRVAVLGATGSIGEATLAVARSYPDRLRVSVLAAQGTRPARLVELAREFGPDRLVVAGADSASALRGELPAGTSLASGEEALLDAVGSGNVDLVVTAIVGAAGLRPAAAALAAGADLALANKEAMVAAGPVLRRLAAASGASILPVDSEHAAIHQALRAGRPQEVRRLLLTASGGPFLDRDPTTLETVTPAEATAHPTWDMGAKISVDSATLMNKGLELIEASYLFDVAGPRIDIVIHPQSLVHSIVEFCCGNGIAQISANDMQYPHPVRALVSRTLAAARRRGVGRSERTAAGDLETGVPASRSGPLPRAVAGSRCPGPERRRTGGAERGQRDRSRRVSQPQGPLHRDRALGGRGARTPRPAGRRRRRAGQHRGGLGLGFVGSSPRTGSPGAFRRLASAGVCVDAP